MALHVLDSCFRGNAPQLRFAGAILSHGGKGDLLHSAKMLQAGFSPSKKIQAQPEHRPVGEAAMGRSPLLLPRWMSLPRK